MEAIWTKIEMIIHSNKQGEDPTSPKCPSKMSQGTHKLLWWIPSSFGPFRSFELNHQTTKKKIMSFFITSKL